MNSCKGDNCFSVPFKPGPSINGTRAKQTWVQMQTALGKSVPDHPWAGGPMLVRAAGVFVCVPMTMTARRPVLMSFLFHHQWLIGTQFVSLMGDLCVWMHVRNLWSANSPCGLFAAIRAVDRVQPAAHGLELLERAAFAACIFIQWHRFHLSSWNQSNNAANL